MAYWEQAANARWHWSLVSGCDQTRCYGYTHTSWLCYIERDVTVVAVFCGCTMAAPVLTQHRSESTPCDTHQLTYRAEAFKHVGALDSVILCGNCKVDGVTAVLRSHSSCILKSHCPVYDLADPMRTLCVRLNTVTFSGTNRSWYGSSDVVSLILHLEITPSSV
jgi:hypothetical protein